jgi:hypothetical protein
MLQISLSLSVDLASYTNSLLLVEEVLIKRAMPMDDSIEPPPSSNCSNDDNNASLVNHYHSPSSPAGRKNLRLVRGSRRTAAAERAHASENKSTLIVLFMLYLCGCAMVGTAVGFVVAYCGLGGRCFFSSLGED